jgi:hypothetical protein
MSFSVCLKRKATAALYAERLSLAVVTTGSPSITAT